MVPINENSVEEIENCERKKRGRRPSKKKTYYCRQCGYNSDRHFNVERHAERIHSESIIKICCDIQFFKKSDYYQHIEDYHPSTRSSCFVSRHKYKIYNRKMESSSGLSYETNITNTVINSNIGDESTAIRRSTRIQELIIKKRELTPNNISAKSEYDEYDNEDIGHYDNNKSEESTYGFYNYEQMKSSSPILKENKNSEYKKSENIISYSAGNSYCPNNIRHEFIQKEEINNIQDTINCSRSLQYRQRLPLKKRILCEINTNVNKSFIPKNSDIKMKKMSSSNDKENHNTINIFFNQYQGTTVVRKLLTPEQSMQMWNNITQRQRDYLENINFNSF